mmetsp:Transcript_19511/g.25219  ORF Transcript_19511/g.25219 Transcript_19511/m.25219 type:complete len:337 (-) Transcript_19511:197-1207(-)
MERRHKSKTNRTCFPLNNIRVFFFCLTLLLSQEYLLAFNIAPLLQSGAQRRVVGQRFPLPFKSDSDCSRFSPRAHGVAVKAKEYPQEVIDQEESESPFRPLRYGFFAVCGVGGFASALISLAGFVGIQPAKDLGKSLDLPNFFLDIAVVVAAFFMWFVEETAKRQHYESIIEEQAIQRRLEKANRPKKSRKQRALAEVTNLQEAEAPMSANLKDDITSQSGQLSGLDARREKVGAEQEAGGLFSSLKATFEEANELGKAQAIMLNSALEEKGILEPVQRIPLSDKKVMDESSSLQLKEDLGTKKLPPNMPADSIKPSLSSKRSKKTTKKSKRRQKK